MGKILRSTFIRQILQLQDQNLIRKIWKLSQTSKIKNKNQEFLSALVQWQKVVGIFLRDGLKILIA